MPMIVGEWSLATDNCAMWLNGLNDNLPGGPKVRAARGVNAALYATTSEQATRRWRARWCPARSHTWGSSRARLACRRRSPRGRAARLCLRGAVGAPPDAEAPLQGPYGTGVSGPMFGKCPVGMPWGTQENETMSRLASVARVPSRGPPSACVLPPPLQAREPLLQVLLCGARLVLLARAPAQSSPPEPALGHTGEAPPTAGTFAPSSSPAGRTSRRGGSAGSRRMCPTTPRTRCKARATRTRPPPSRSRSSRSRRSLTPPPPRRRSAMSASRGQRRRWRPPFASLRCSPPRRSPFARGVCSRPRRNRTSTRKSQATRKAEPRWGQSMGAGPTAGGQSASHALSRAHPRSRAVGRARRCAFDTCALKVYDKPRITSHVHTRIRRRLLAPHGR